MLGFEIGQRESGFYSERNRITDGQTDVPSSTVLVYKFTQSTKLPNSGPSAAQV